MAEKPKADRGSRNPKAPASEPVQNDSGPPGDGGAGVWTDQFGRTCIGNQCFYAALDQERNEIRVVIDDTGPCGGATQESILGVVGILKDIAGKGADTLYQTKSRT